MDVTVPPHASSGKEEELLPPFLELVSEAVAEQLQRIKSDTAIRDTGVDWGMKHRGGLGYEKRP